LLSYAQAINRSLANKEQTGSEEGNAMRPLSKWSFQTGAAVLIASLLLGLFAVQPARADVVLDDPLDPAIINGYSASLIGINGGTQTTNSWFYGYTTESGGTVSVSFLNNTGADWTTLDIVAHYTNTGAHTFTARVSPSTANLPAGATTAFNAGSATILTSDTVAFSFSGPPAVPMGDYLVFAFTNWNSDSGSALTGFDFKVNGGDPPSVPEPSTLLLLGSGLLGLVGYGRKRMRK
jgi:hypothetical protein